MPAKITFTQKEEDALEHIEAYHSFNSEKQLDALKSLLAKMKKARVKDKEPAFHGISVKDFIEMATAKLGTKLKLPDNLTKDWIIKMQRALNSGGVTKEVASKGIESASKTWQNDIWIETLIYSVHKLAAGVTMGSGTGPVKKTVGFTPTKKSGWMGRLEED